MSPNTQSSKEVKDLLLADHRQFSEMFLKNEQMGETRVNWFIGIVTAVSGALVALITKEKAPIAPPTMRWIVIAALVALLIFGFLTLLRMIKRNASTDGQKRALDNVRQTFQDHFDPGLALHDYYPFRVPKKKKQKNARLRNKLSKIRQFGGLAHFVAGINSVLVAAIAAAFTYDAGYAPSLQNFHHLEFHAEVGLVGSFIIQWVVITWREIKDKDKLDKSDPTHAGGVVFQIDGDGSLKYLLVRPSNKKREWVLPKGHIDEGELHQDAAVREVREETGVGARPIGPVGRIKYKLGDDELRVKFYLMESMLEGTPDEPREHKWLGFVEAREALTHSENKKILEMAETLRRAN